MLSEKNTYRAIARMTDHHLDTVRAIADAVAQHCKKFNDYFITELKLTPIEIDEMWSYVKKNKKTLSPSTLRTMNKVMRTLTSQSRGKAACT